MAAICSLAPFVRAGCGAKQWQQSASSTRGLADRGRQRRSKCLTPPAAVFGRLLELPVFRGGGGSAARAAAEAKRRLLGELASERPDKAVISQACDELMAAKVPFREGDLGGGPWQVVYTRGALLWQGLNTSPGGRVVNSTSNQASQDFDPRTRRVVNRGELLGPAVVATAGGSYEPVDRSSSSGSGGKGTSTKGGSGSKSSNRCPILVRASIEGGSLQAWGQEVALPIRGSGLVEIAYLDASGLRIFRATNGSISVQMRQPPAAAARR